MNSYSRQPAVGAVDHAAGRCSKRDLHQVGQRAVERRIAKAVSSLQRALTSFAAADMAFNGPSGPERPLYPKKPSQRLIAAQRAGNPRLEALAIEALEAVRSYKWDPLKPWLNRDEAVEQIESIGRLLELLR